MPPALIAAGVGAAASIGGAIIGSNSTKKAAQQAADTSLQVAQQNNALARDIYGQNREALSPFMQRGNAAGDAINALLGLGGAAPTPQPTPQMPSTGTPMAQNGFYQGDFNSIGSNPLLPRGSFTNDIDRRTPLSPMSGGTMHTMGAPVAAPAGGNPGQADAFQRFRDSTGYQFRLNEGTNALTSQFASGGALNSGAAAKALLRYGQDYGSNEFGKYMGYLTNQQGVGLSGASALAGVGQGYANSVMANNNLAGESAANAALMRGAANNQMWSGIGSGVGNLFGSSFGLLFGKGK